MGRLMTNPWDTIKFQLKYNLIYLVEERVDKTRRKIKFYSLSGCSAPKDQ